MRGNGQPIAAGLITAIVFVWKEDAGFARFLARVGLRAILSRAGFLAGVVDSCGVTVRGELRIHLESWSDDGDRWWLSKTRHQGVEHPDALLAELRYLLLEVEPVYE